MSEEQENPQPEMPRTAVERGLLLEFFLTFARFEYALKASGFFKRLRDPQLPYRADPDWDSFAVSLRDRFDRNGDAQLTGACDYLLESPPRRQVVVNGTVAWETPIRDVTISEIEFLLRMVRSVRNNLFHGGKHNIAVHETPERTERLLRSCLTILAACLEMSPDQAAAYEEAVL